jgi:serine/threonine protein kinase
MTGLTMPESNDQALQTLVAECIQVLGEKGSAAVEGVLARYPALASAVRAQLAQLRRAGLLDEAKAAVSLPPIPATIGPYRILEAVGSGGMGVVYLAEQREPVRRKVAVKVIKLGMDTREVVARFGAERQALAMMTHANIARVLDAGSSDDGRPYFVMEYVAGLPLTEYCDRHHLATKQRLALFLAVCDGVQHAHLKGVIHRDLKPSNVLVAEQDGQPLPKIIDFGVAKAIGPRLTEATLHTHAGMVVGTPEYMSPEQAGRDVLDVDTRTDVYSLGVLLYELVTGQLPFESARLRRDWSEMQRILREEDPKTPSQRLATTHDTATDIARRRATDVIALRRELRGDLDWICLKALEKERDRRYATVNDLAADIRRHLANEPVLASPPSRLYRLRKFVRRNAVQVAAGVVVIFALVAGLAVSVLYWRQARDAAHTAVRALAGESAARGAAEANFERALAAVDQMLLRVGDTELAEVPQMEATRKALLSDALAFYREILRERTDDPRTQFEAARVQTAEASLLNQLGDHAGATVAADAAVRTLRVVAAARPQPIVSVRLARALCEQAEAAANDNKADAAIALLDAAVAELLSTLQRDPGLPAVNLDLATTLQRRAVQWEARDRERALADHRAAVAQSKIAVTAGLDGAAGMAARCRLGLFGALVALGQVALAEQELLALRDELVAQSRDDKVGREVRETLADTLTRLAATFFARGQFDQFEVCTRDELRLRQAILAEQAHTPRRRADLARCHANLGIALANGPEPAAAEAEFRQAVRLLEALVAEVPLPAHRASLATHSHNLALHLIRDKSLAGLREAREHCERALAQTVALAAEDPKSHWHADNVTGIRNLLAGIVRQLGDAQAASALAEVALADAQALAAREPTLDHYGTLIGTAAEAAESAFELEQLTRARTAVDVGLAAMERMRAVSDDPDVHRSMQCVLLRLAGLIYARAGEHEAAAAKAFALLEAGAEDRRSGLAAGDVLRLCWLSLGGQGPQAAEYAARARRHYSETKARLERELEEAPDDPVLRYFRACAVLGGAELDAGAEQPAALIAELEPALAVLREEFTHSSVSPMFTAQVRSGYALLAQASLSAGDAVRARQAAAQLVAISAGAPEPLLRAAVFFARCAETQRGTPEQTTCSDLAVGALQQCLDAGFADPARIEGDATLAAVLASDAARTLRARLAAR